MRAAGTLLILALFGAGCAGEEHGTSAVDESARFENLSAKYLGDAACFDCHEDEYRGFQEHGMANSLYPLTADNVVEDFDNATVRDEERNLTYRMYREGDRFFQEEYRLDADGRKVHSLVREMQFVMGSGTAARTYLVEENGYYHELPVTWYTQSDRWAFSPGYETYNARFDRLIPDRCMTCHNSYPEPVPHVEGKFLDVPQGIGCERCHGPGSVHVDARLAAPAPADSVDHTIVNPAHLSLDRRLDVCRQCHLHTTVSVLRAGRTAYDFRPSQALSDYVALFAADEPGSESTIDVISHADRMKQSACFLESRSLEEPMDCTTCHDPHEGFRAAGPEYFSETCTTCHDAPSLQEDLPTAEARFVHAEAVDCFSCHMPKVEAEGTPHASFTDHFIRVVDEDAAAQGAGQDGGKPISLNPYFEGDVEDDVYAGMAYVIYGRQQNDTTALRRGIALLGDLEGSGVADGSDGAAGGVAGGAAGDSTENALYGEALFLLGIAHLQLGEIDGALPPLEATVAQGPDIPERLNALAQAYESDGRSADVIERLYDRALDIQPLLANVRVNYGRYLESRRQPGRAVEQYRAAIAERPWLETAHFNLGTAYLRDGDIDAGELALREAIRLDPDYGEALSNLGLLLAGQGREQEARVYFERAAEAEPDHPVTLGNLGAFYLNTGDLSGAVEALTQAVELDATYVDGLVNLALAYFRLEEYATARRYAERALERAPGNQPARQILDAL
ncbi:MAG: tetratricopeptide repeat protein [Rhodothermales bacterium]